VASEYTTERFIIRELEEFDDENDFPQPSAPEEWERFDPDDDEQ
jgi:hypothetical protein